MKINLVDEDPKQVDFELQNGDLIYNINERKEIFKVIKTSNTYALLIELHSCKIIELRQEPAITYMGVVNKLDSRYTATILWVHIPHDKYAETIKVIDRF